MLQHSAKESQRRAAVLGWSTEHGKERGETDEEGRSEREGERATRSGFRDSPNSHSVVEAGRCQFELECGGPDPIVASALARCAWTDLVPTPEPLQMVDQFLLEQSDGCMDRRVR